MSEGRKARWTRSSLTLDVSLSKALNPSFAWLNDVASGNGREWCEYKAGAGWSGGYGFVLLLFPSLGTEP